MPRRSTRPQRDFGLRMLGKVVVEIEAAIEARGQSLAVENDCADECGGVIALLLQQLRQVGCVGARGTAKSVTPCVLGSRPVRMLVCEVLVIGLGVKAWVKRMPSFASPSSAGVWIVRSRSSERGRREECRW